VQGLPPPTYNRTYTYVAAGLDIPGAVAPALYDGMNSAGLSLGLLWQADAPFNAAYNASGPPGITFIDVAHYVLGSFATVDEVAAWANASTLQITTDLRQDPAMSGAMAHFFAAANAVAAAGQSGSASIGSGEGALSLPIHIHVTDAAGEGVLLEAVPGGGFEAYRTNIATNEPAFLVMVEQMQQYIDSECWLMAGSGSGFAAAVLCRGCALPRLCCATTVLLGLSAWQAVKCLSGAAPCACIICQGSTCSVLLVPRCLCSDAGGQPSCHQAAQY